MAERPILFSTPMVQAILAGRKTVTRRVVTPAPVWRDEVPGRQAGGWSVQGRQKDVGLQAWADASEFAAQLVSHVGCPYGRPGDRLWVRETWGLHIHNDFTHWMRDSIKGRTSDDLLLSWDVAYAADATSVYDHWRPSIHMPRWASRLTLEVTGVRVERLHDITEEDARAEGVERHPTENGWRNYEPEPTFEAVTYHATAGESFASLWRSINGPESWDANPWVWRVEFKRVEANHD